MKSINEKLSQKGKVVIVTGGYRGIGLAIAQNFAQAGASLAICGRNTKAGEAAAEKFRAEGINCKFYTADVTNCADIDRFVAVHVPGSDSRINGKSGSRQARRKHKHTNEHRNYLLQENHILSYFPVTLYSPFRKKSMRKFKESVIFSRGGALRKKDRHLRCRRAEGRLSRAEAHKRKPRKPQGFGVLTSLQFP